MTPLGMVTLVLLLWSATVTVFEAAAVRVTEQIAAPGELTVPGAHVKPLNCVAAARLTVACWLCPLRVAVTMAFWLLLTVPEAAVKVALLWLEATTTLAGTVSNPVLLDRLTVAVLSAALFSVTVQTEVCAVPNVLGAQLTLDNCAGATRLKLVVLAVLLAVAVRVAV